MRRTSRYPGASRRCASQACLLEESRLTLLEAQEAGPEPGVPQVTPNLYGNLVANTAAGIAGGTGFMPGGNVGAGHAVFEQGASAGNVGNEKLVEQKKANPVAMLLSSAMMLRHLQFPSFADRLENAVERAILEGKHRTKDLGGDSTTQEVVDAVISLLD